MPAIVLGPLLRYVDSEVATVWVQVDAPCEVEILGVRERSWCVDGLHFALIAIEGLQPGVDHPYEVLLDGVRAWPEPDSTWPASTIKLLPTDGALDLAFGSCRISRPHEPPYVLRSHEHPHGQGIDALRAYAIRAAKVERARPDMLLMLGDQIYADEPSPALKATLAGRDRPADAPGDELANFQEYALAYEEAWSEPAIRWLLSTVPTAMIFDDHEIHAEWRISRAWMDEMTDKPWFDRHICAGLMGYWVFQHIGNLPPAELAQSDLYRAVRDADDAGKILAREMDDAGHQLGHSRWSYARELGDARLVVIDSRAGRKLEKGNRTLVDDDEWDWIAEQARKPARHLLLASSVPFLLAPGLHDTEAWDEAITDGAWGPVAARVGEFLRRKAVMDHWASFQKTHARMADVISAIAHGDDAPESIVMLSGDVHHCYLAEVDFPAGPTPPSAVWQAVCSGFRKELAPHEKVVIKFGHSKIAARLARRAARAAGVAELPFSWRLVERPDYANQIGTVTLADAQSSVRVERVVDGHWHDPQLQTAFERHLTRQEVTHGDPQDLLEA
ncbi:MAG TPA: alkaline phosphatase D family protein [Baekduia sp.]|nr:alkaline phosphatase D family protein [Baekduia sp.]